MVHPVRSWISNALYCGVQAHPLDVCLKQEWTHSYVAPDGRQQDARHKGQGDAIIAY